MINPAKKCNSPKGFEPLSTNRQGIENIELTKNQKSVLDTSLDKLVQKYPEIEQIISIWPELSEQDREAIIDIVKR